MAEQTAAEPQSDQITPEERIATLRAELQALLVEAQPTLEQVEQEAVPQVLHQARQKIAQAKAEWHLAQAGVKGYDHPGTIKQAIDALCRAEARFAEMLAKGEGIPGPTGLEVAGKKIEVASEVPSPDGQPAA